MRARGHGHPAHLWCSGVHASRSDDLCFVAQQLHQLLGSVAGIAELLKQGVSGEKRIPVAKE